MKKFFISLVLVLFSSHAYSVETQGHIETLTMATQSGGASYFTIKLPATGNCSKEYGLSLTNDKNLYIYNQVLVAVAADLKVKVKSLGSSCPQSYWKIDKITVIRAN